MPKVFLRFFRQSIGMPIDGASLITIEKDFLSIVTVRFRARPKRKFGFAQFFSDGFTLA